MADTICNHAETSGDRYGAERAIAEALAPTVVPMPPPKLPAQNFIARHWRGELSLARAYWVNHLLLGTIASVAVVGLAWLIERDATEQPVRWLIALLVTWSLIIAFSTWAMVGIWRSATAYRRSGKRYWGAAAKLAVLLGAIQLALAVASAVIPQAIGICEILSGDTRLGPHQFKAQNNGTMLDFSGGITFGTARELELMLNAMDNVRTIRLNSDGGRVAEAQKMAELIRARGLSTFVTGHCVSACTIAFLGGKQRYLLSTAKLGFHQPYFPGMTADAKRSAIVREQIRLQYFGLSRAFAERANRASPSDMWYPELDELVRERVVTAVVTPQRSKPETTVAPAPPAPTVSARL